MDDQRRTVGERSDMCVVNAMYAVQLKQRLNLDLLHQRLKGSRLFRGRPRMLTLKTANYGTMIMFPKGKIQFLGKIGAEAVNFLCLKLQPLIFCDCSDIELCSMTVVYNFHRSFNFKQIISSSYNTLYEKELFSAVQISWWNPIHVHVFHTGKAVFTGVKHIEQLYSIIDELEAYLI